MTYSDRLVDFLKAWEGGPFLEPHWDDIGKCWDIGYGHVLLPTDARREITIAEAEELIHWDLQVTDAGVRRMLKVPVVQHQYDTCCTFAYNVGLDDDDDVIAEGFGDSKFLKLINLNAMDAAAAQITLWVNAQGKFVQGLLNRRLAEQAMFVNGEYRLP